MTTQDSTLTLPSPRKSRSKIRKPKFLSLRLQLNSAAPSPMPHHLINLFPLHPENLVDQDKLDDDNHNMARIFSSCDASAATLTGILCSSDQDKHQSTENPSPSSANFADDHGELVRTAMRRAKTERHEKWVCYSEVVEKKKVIKGGLTPSLTLTSSSSSCNDGDYDRNYDYRSDNPGPGRSRGKLVLKLDYEKIMESWVNKGPFYVRGDAAPGMDSLQPQTVPELQDDDLFVPASNGKKNDSSNGGLWTVPEMVQIENNDGSEKVGEEEALQLETSNAMMHHREASVQRYKEKRRNRLFAKTIRYQVRKLNAEKRPRIKGRFVKRN